MKQASGRLFLVFVVLLLSTGIGTEAWAGMGGQGTELSSVPPSLGATSQEKVLFRYKFKTGQKVDYRMDLNMDMVMAVMGQKINMNMLMGMDGYYTVKSVAANGDGLVELLMTRVTMKATAPNVNMNYDSAKGENPDPNLNALKAMLNVPIPVKISAIGKMLAMDINPLEQAMKKAGAAAQMMNFGDTTDQLVKSTFVMLSEQPIKVGDKYDAGEIVQKMQNIGEMTAKASYQVMAVAADKKKALLKPSGKFTLKAASNPSIQIKLNSDRFDGWMLFDLANGFIERSFGDLQMNMTASQAGQSMDFDMKMKIYFQEKMGK